MVHYCSTESQCKDYKEKPGSCGSAAVPLLEIASKEKKTRHCKSCREANLGDHLLKYQGKFGSVRWTCKQGQSTVRNNGRPLLLRMCQNVY